MPQADLPEQKLTSMCPYNPVACNSIPSGKAEVVLIGILAICLLAIICLLPPNQALAGQLREYRLGIVLPGNDPGNMALRDAVLTNLNSAQMQGMLDWGGRGTLANDAQFFHSSGDATERLDSIARSLMQRNDIDLVISCNAMTTQALLRHNNGRIAIFHMADEDPLLLPDGRLLPNGNIGNLHLAPHRLFTRDNVAYLKSMDMKGAIKSIGLIYENSPYGKRAARLDEMIDGCKKAGITLLAEPMPDSSPQSCRKAINAVAQKNASLFYLNPEACFNTGGLEGLLEPLTERGTPAYGDKNPKQAAYGAMLTFTQSQLARNWQAAYGIATVLSGKNVTLPALYVENEISLNLAVAARVGFVPSYDLLATVDFIFWKVLDENAGEAGENSEKKRFPKIGF